MHGILMISNFNAAHKPVGSYCAFEILYPIGGQNGIRKFSKFVSKFQLFSRERMDLFSQCFQKEGLFKKISANLYQHAPFLFAIASM